jgi:hypothetical protein
MAPPASASSRARPRLKVHRGCRRCRRLRCASWRRVGGCGQSTSQRVATAPANRRTRPPGSASPALWPVVVNTAGMACGRVGALRVQRHQGRPHALLPLGLRALRRLDDTGGFGEELQRLAVPGLAGRPLTRAPPARRLAGWPWPGRRHRLRQRGLCRGKQRGVPAVAAWAGRRSANSPLSGMHTSLQTSHSACSLMSSAFGGKTRMAPSRPRAAAGCRRSRSSSAAQWAAARRGPLHRAGGARRRAA